MNDGGATTDAVPSAPIEAGSIAAIDCRSARAFARPWPTTYRFQARILLALLFGGWLAIGLGDNRAASSPPSLSAEVWAVETAFREAFQLWADERFAALWERGLLAAHSF